jgi:hypothetical protein
MAPVERHVEFDAYETFGDKRRRHDRHRLSMADIRA